jgi:type IV secretory pathway TrbF-like protein
MNLPDLSPYVGFPFFDDLQSYGHAALGAVSAQFAPMTALIIAALFAAYQIWQSTGSEQEPWQNTTGDLLEFGVGYAAGSLLKQRYA